jgi:hypothetical protein
MNPHEVAEATPLQHALDGFATALDHLVKVVDDGAVDDLDAVGLVGFLQEFEVVRNRLPVVDHRVIRSAVERDLPAHAVSSFDAAGVDAGVATVPG